MSNITPEIPNNCLNCKRFSIEKETEELNLNTKVPVLLITGIRNCVALSPPSPVYVQTTAEELNCIRPHFFDPIKPRRFQ